MNRLAGLFAVVVMAAVGVLGTGAAASAVPSPQDVSYLVAAHQGDLYAMAAGAMASEKGSSEQVKQLGRRLADDHAKFDEAVVSVAGQVKAALPKLPDEYQRSVLKELAAAPPGEVFDQMWLTRQIDSQGDMLAGARTEWNYGYDTRVKDLARQADDMLIEHMTELNRADAEVNAG